MSLIYAFPGCGKTYFTENYRDLLISKKRLFDLEQGLLDIHDLDAAIKLTRFLLFNDSSSVILTNRWELGHMLDSIPTPFQLAFLPRTPEQAFETLTRREGQDNPSLPSLEVWTDWWNRAHDVVAYELWYIEQGQTLSDLLVPLLVQPNAIGDSDLRRGVRLSDRQRARFSTQRGLPLAPTRLLASK